ncbi:hypothetical protein K8U54_21225 [Pseudomonas fulva]|uniref:BRO-N domain-containing protein n=1 Tax=Pseudomonas fulva TaxID=47880 RepID=UPI00201D8B76|nr:BRO family protein [Pseudomonas fulva]UQY34202.1 hypothetical protein K8U54_21225 [Pseudomonas fulva]
MNAPLLLDYHAEHGTSKIRSLYINEKLYVSLEDVIRTLVSSNKHIEGGSNSFASLVKAQLGILDEDECEYFPTPGEDHSPRKEPFITEPGLYRIISRDSTPASKKFQRWIFHDVIPSVRKYGTYPAPLQTGSSDLMSLAQTLAQHTNILIREIQEREKLALETKLRFNRTEQQLNDLNEKIDYITASTTADELIEIKEYCTKHSIDIDQQHLRAMCTKLRLEQSIPSRKIYRDGEEHRAYPPEVIANAIALINQ